MNNIKDLKPITLTYTDSKEFQDQMLDRILNMVNLSNEQFKNLSNKEKRVAIAKDVLSQLDLKRIKAESGTYLVTEDDRCTCCALGSLVVASCSLKDKSIHNMESFDDCKDHLKKYFSTMQLNLIESAFEYDYDCGYDFSKAAQLSDKKRLKMIMKNIIKNNGKFIPESFIKKIRSLWL